MKRRLKIGLVVLAAVVGLPLLTAGGAFAYVFGVKPTRSPAPALVAPNTPEAVERGRYLATHVYQCVFCHSPFDPSQPGLPGVEGRELAGRDWREETRVEEFKDAFQIYAPNISIDNKAGIGGWTDGEIVRATREGVAKDDSPLFEFMPYKTYRELMSDADALAVVAFLRASPAQATRQPRSAFPLAADVFGRRLPPQPVATPYPGPPAAPKERGEWLLSVALCHFCHDTRGDGPEVLKPLGGGEQMNVPGGPVIAPNISSDPAGVGSMSEDEIVKALSEGVGRGGRMLRAMPWTRYAGLTAEDKRAIAIALKASPPVH